MTTKTIQEIKELLFDQCNFEFSNFQIEKESSEYFACRFEINNKKVLFRSAKITPTKTGQFVTLWKRKKENSSMAPFEISDDIDLFIINTRTKTNFGQFVFPKSVLVEQGIITDKKEGKRGFRIYPDWDLTESKQAKKTQNWQLDYFIKIPFDEPLDTNRAISLYLKNSIL